MKYQAINGSNCREVEAYLLKALKVSKKAHCAFVFIHTFVWRMEGVPLTREAVYYALNRTITNIALYDAVNAARSFHFDPKGACFGGMELFLGRRICAALEVEK